MSEEEASVSSFNANIWGLLKDPILRIAYYNREHIDAFMRYVRCQLSLAEEPPIHTMNVVILKFIYGFSGLNISSTMDDTDPEMVRINMAVLRSG